MTATIYLQDQTETFDGFEQKMSIFITIHRYYYSRIKYYNYFKKIFEIKLVSTIFIIIVVIYLLFRRLELSTVTEYFNFQKSLDGK